MGTGRNALALIGLLAVGGLTNSVAAAEVATPAKPAPDARTPALFGNEVEYLKAWIDKAVVCGAKLVSDRPIVTLRSGTREVMLQDPDSGGFVLLFEQP